MLTKSAVVSTWRRTRWYYQCHSVMKSMKVSSAPWGCDLCQPLVSQEANRGACLHNGGGFVGVLKWHFSVVLGKHRAGNSSEVTHCYAVSWHGLHSASTLMVIAAIFSDLWPISPPSFSTHLFPLSSSTFCFSSPSHPPTSTVYHLLHRPQAGHDLRLLADGLAGELLQYCHAHQAGGSRQGRETPLLFVLWPLQQRGKMDERSIFLEPPLSYTIYQMWCCRGWEEWPPVSDHEWSPFALVAMLQGQSFDIYEGVQRNMATSVLWTVPLTVYVTLFGALLPTCNKLVRG